MISAFPMYEVSNIEHGNSAFLLMQTKTDEWYSSILQEFKNSMVECKESECIQWIPPQMLSRSKSTLASLSDTAKEGKLFLGQVCSLPALVYNDSFQIIASPSYAVDGCDNYFARSVLIVRADSTIETLEGLIRMRPYQRDMIVAVSSRTSTSGCLLFAATFGRDFMDHAIERVKFTGSHLGSIHCVSDGRADIAAVDCVTFATVRRYFPDLLGAVKIIGYTVSVPSAPYVTSASAPPGIVSRLKSSLIKAIVRHDNDQEKAMHVSELFLTGFHSKEDLAAYYRDYMNALQRQASASLSEISTAFSSLIGPPLTNSLQAIDINTLWHSASAGADLVPVPIRTIIPPEYIRQYLQPLLPIDMAFMETLLACLRSELTYQLSSSSGIDRSQPWSAWRAISGERSVRMIFPRGLDNAAALLTPDSTAPLNMVCFIGRRRAIQHCPATDLDTVQSCWAADAELVEKLPGSLSLAMYATAEMEHGGDWGNILLLRSNQVANPIAELLQQLNTTSMVCPHSQGASQSSYGISHETAMATISPRYYSAVRLHRVLYYAHVSHQPLCIQRTTFIQYDPTEDLEGASIHRNMVHWEEAHKDAKSNLYRDYFGHNDSLIWESVLEWNMKTFTTTKELLSLQDRELSDLSPSLGGLFDLLSDTDTTTDYSMCDLHEEAALLLMREVDVALQCSRLAGTPLIPHPILLPYLSEPKSADGVDCSIYILHICIRDIDDDLSFGRVRRGQAVLSKETIREEHWLRVPFFDLSSLLTMGSPSFENVATKSHDKLQLLRFMSWSAQRSLHDWLLRIDRSDLDDSASMMAIAVADCRERLLKLCKMPPISNGTYGSAERLRAEIFFCFHEVVQMLEDPRTRKLHSMNHENNPILVVERLNILGSLLN